MDHKRVVITGLGAITPIGLDIEEFWQGLAQGRNGVRKVTSFDATKHSIKLAAEVNGFNAEKYMPIKRVDRNSRTTHMAIAAAKMAIESAKLDMTREKRERAGTIIATGGAPTLLIDQAELLKNRGPRGIDPLLASKVGSNMVGVQVGMEFGLKGPNSTINSACSSGSDSIGVALNHIRLGHADVMITGGADATIAPITFAATGIVGALTKNPDPNTACRPFDLNRNGFVFGEGAGMLVLETEEHAVKRGAPILAELAGAGWSFDAYNETAPFADTQALAMRTAIEDAGISPEDVDYINAHGTSTQLNDSTETRAVKMVFGQRAYKIPMSSNKSMIGHLATAAGSVEAVATVLTILHNIIPPTINYQTPDPECDLDYVPNKSRNQKVNVCLSNSFGLGGQNCCLVIKGLTKMSKELAGKVALITGASRGLGKAIAIKLASMGAKVAVNYLTNDAEAAKVAESISSQGGEALPVKANVADSEAVKNMVRHVVDKWGKIDILVNNAGITRDGLLPRMSDEAWDEVINTNLRGAYLCTKFALRSMMNQNWGRIINVSSLAGLAGNVGQANYSASKGGLIAFTKAVAREVGSRNITANVIAPGFFVTDMTNKLPQEAKDTILSRIPLRRFGQPEDLAELAGFLASEQAGYITAQVICIDGGVM